MNKIKLYMCGNDDCDIHFEATDVVLYTNLDYFKKKRSCWKSCGIKELVVDLDDYLYIETPLSRSEQAKKCKD